MSAFIYGTSRALAWVGGLVISQGLGLTSVPLAAAALAALALLAALLTTSLGSIPAAEPLLD